MFFVQNLYMLIYILSSREISVYKIRKKIGSPETVRKAVFTVAINISVILQTII